MTRQARWVDFENDYRTMDLSFMESVLWAFKRLYDKGLAYEGYRVLPYCWECETPLSNFETRQDDSYRDRTDPAITVRFDLEPVDDGPELPAAGRSGCSPGRRRLGRCPPISPSRSDRSSSYAVVAHGGRRLVIGEACLEAYADVLDGADAARHREGG